MLQIAFGLLLLFCGCSQPTTSLPPWQHINGRDDGSSLTREPLYHARIPETWHRMDPDLSTSIADTTTSICEFIIEDSDGPLRISIHNFPADDLSERIPPIAQISRWQRQLAMTCSTASIVVPVSHGGFTGLYIRGGGSMEGRPASILAWAMQLSSIHFRNLAHHNRQLRSDYTIKATGAPNAMDRHRDAIEQFARSFELIEELPEPS